MAFVHASGFEARALKVPVHVASKDAVAVSHRRCQVPQDTESGVGDCSPIELESLPVEAPCLFWSRTECLRRSDVVEPDPIMFQRWVYAPEAIRTAKIRQSGIDPHTCPCRNDDGGSFSHPASSGQQFNIVHKYYSKYCCLLPFMVISKLSRQYETNGNATLEAWRPSWLEVSIF
ncbi:hypothetical protein CO2235_200070 [Cupriavidus oxalaticus]|uniref:Uncharacterized protein n=1 Tax=Cupriavidus oxalaticus TaxID=96344 RepID=A0A976GA22_9BURK|nr:hypothetical protein CO2235_200070 [Cupriavidus oxalaticus]